ncbi:hypothetical protein M569_16569, partial [Genlisea aurea]
LQALRHLREMSQDISQSNSATNWGRRPAALRAFNHRLLRGFNEAVNGLSEEGWSPAGSDDAMDDVSILVNRNPDKLLGLNNTSFAKGFDTILCAKASMLLQNVAPVVVLRFLREHRAEWAAAGGGDSDSSYAGFKNGGGSNNFLGPRAGNFQGQVTLPLAQTFEHEELLEVIKLEEGIMPRDTLFLQMCSGMDENAVGSFAELVFAPIDASLTDDTPLLPSGFRIIPLDSCKESSSPTRTLDLASALETGTNKTAIDEVPPTSKNNAGKRRCLMTIAFQFACEGQMTECMASMARRYIRGIISSVQRVTLALSSSSSSRFSLRSHLGTPEAATLAYWICRSYRNYMGVELLKCSCEEGETLLKALWHHTDAIFCCSIKASPVFTFANQAGLDMLETTPVALREISLEKILDDHGRKNLWAEFPRIMNQGFGCIQGGVCLSSMSRPVSYEQVAAWKVMNGEEEEEEKEGGGGEGEEAHCICFMFVNWSFV